MPILIIAEHKNGALADATFNTITAVKDISCDIHLLVAGRGVDSVTDVGSKIAYVAKVLKADSAAYAHMSAENVALLIAELAQGSSLKTNYSHVIAPASANSMNYLPRAAALLGVDIISEIISIESPSTFKRLTHEGKAIVTVKSCSKITVLSMQAPHFEKVVRPEDPSPIETLQIVHYTSLSRFIGEK